MADNLGRDKLPWSQAIWQEIDKAVLDEVGRLRVAQKVFHSAKSPDNQYVPADSFDPQTMTIAEGQTKPFIEIGIEFRLTQLQVEKEEAYHTARTLARLAAKSIALAEDMLFFQGARAKLPAGVKVINGESANGGLLNHAIIHRTTVDPLNKETPGVYGANTFQKVTQGMASLTKNVQPGPYALILWPDVYADTYAPIAGSLATTADRLTPLLGGGFYCTATVPESTGLLISLGGEPTTLYVGQDTITAYTHDEAGIHCFRVFERVQLVERDPRAFVRLDFA